MDGYILAVDQGTTSTRAIIFDKLGQVVKIGQEEFTQYYPQPGWVEHDATEIWLKTLAVMAKVLSLSQIQPSEIKAIGITNQRETTVIWDKNTGLPVYHAIVWQSRQSDDICARLIDAGHHELFKQKTGLPIDPYFSATKIKWIFENVEGTYEKALKGDLLFGTIDTWLLWKLTGNLVHATDVSNASRTMLFNIYTLSFDDELLDILQIPKSILPEVKPSSCIYGKTAPYHFFNQEVLITSLIGDQQAALFGQCCFERGLTKNTFGTGGFLLMNTGKQVIVSNHGLISSVGWQINDEVVYVLEGSVFVSGSLIQWLRDGLGIIKHESETETMANDVVDTKGVYIVPAFAGLGAPYWKDHCQGSILGISAGVTKDHLVRAALEAMAYQSKDILDVMVKDANIDIPVLRVDGGASKNNFLLQFQSDILQIPVETIETSETTALGAAYLAGLCIGYYKMDELKAKAKATFEPKMDPKKVEKLYLGWLKAIGATQQF